MNRDDLTLLKKQLQAEVRYYGYSKETTKAKIAKIKVAGKNNNKHFTKIKQGL